MHLPEPKAIETIELDMRYSGAAWMDAIKQMVGSGDHVAEIYVEKLYRDGQFVRKLTVESGQSTLASMAFCPLGHNEARVHFFNPEHQYDRVEVISLADDTCSVEDCARAVVDFARGVANILKRGATAPA